VPVKADGAEMIVAERPYGTFSRQVFLGETLDAEHLAADYAAGVLTLTIPVHEAAKPRPLIDLDQAPVKSSGVYTLDSADSVVRCRPGDSGRADACRR
jgi:Hsp20/alpha crystallin family